MADIQLDIPTWDAQGSLWPDGYYYVEGEAPVDAWDNKFNYEVSRVLNEDIVPRLNDSLEHSKGTTRPSQPEEGEIFWDIDGENNNGNPQFDIHSDANSQWYTLATRTWVQTNATASNSDKIDGLHLDQFAMNRRTFHVGSSDGTTEYAKIAKISDGSTSEEGDFHMRLINASHSGYNAGRTLVLQGGVKKSSFDIKHHIEGTDYVDVNTDDVLITETAGTGTNSENEYYIYIRLNGYTDSVVTVDHANTFGSFDFQENIAESNITGSIVYDTDTGTEDANSRYGPIYSEGDRVATRDWVLQNNTDAETLDGFDSSQFAILDQNETITANWTFDKRANFKNTIDVYANNGHVDLFETDNSDKQWRFEVNAGEFRVTEVGVNEQLQIEPGGLMHIPGGATVGQHADGPDLHITSGPDIDSDVLVVDGDGDDGQDDDIIKARANSAGDNFVDSDTKFVVKGDGRVGVGTYSPGNAFDVYWNGQHRLKVNDSNGDVSAPTGRIGGKRGWACVSDQRRKVYVGSSFPGEAKGGDLLFEPV
jgi:hypothetical protein